MSVELIESKNRIARKEHTCDYCHETIKKGEEYSYQKNLYDEESYD